MEDDDEVRVAGTPATGGTGDEAAGPLLDALLAPFVGTADAEAAALALRAMRFGRLVERHLGELLRPTGLDRSELSVLMALLLTPPDEGQTPSELARVVVQTTSGMTKTVNRLTGRGLVERREAAGDGRSVDVLLTAEGRALAARLLGELSEGFGEALAPAGEDSRAALTAALVAALPALERSAGVRRT